MLSSKNIKKRRTTSLSRADAPDRGADIMSAMKRKKELMAGPVLFSKEAEAPAPSKDYCSIVVSKKGVLWRKWRITLRGVASGSAPLPMPTEECLSHLDFRCQDELIEEVKRVFGRDIYSHIEGIMTGCQDILTCLPEAAMLVTCSYLDLRDIQSLACTNRYMNNFCNSDALWRQLYVTYQAPPTSDLVEISKRMGWKKIFYMSKLHLQKELSRRRKNQASGSPST